ncbi:MAG: SPOR domain-containing protein, partial [Prevotella sp.]|nr:SPOR domain-containing protein [Prevotella sp.]
MMKLERHIEILLLDNDCVIVPDFGGFVAHQLCARYDESEGIFLPPLRTLGFNPQLRLNDSLLAQSYVETYDISYPEALRRIAAEVDELRAVLSREGRYEFNDLGTITLNADGRYESTPHEAGILTPELYGLTSFEMPQLQHRAMKKSLFNGEETITIKLSTIRNVAAACIAALVFWLFPSAQGDSQYSVANSQFNTELLKRIMPKDITT